MKALLLAPMGSVHRRFNQANIEALRVLGCEIHLAANFNIGEGTEKQNSEYAQSCGTQGIKVHHIPFERHSLKKNISKVRFVRELLKQEDFYLVHAHTETGGLILRLAGKTDPKQKFYYTPHGMSFYKGSSIRSQIVYRPIEKWICAGMDCNIAINREEYAVLKHWNIQTAAFVHGTGIDFSRMRTVQKNRHEIREALKIPMDAKVILSVGELDENKNHQVVIQAIGNMDRRDVYYLICGVGPKKEDLLKLAEEKGLENQIILAGYRKDIPDVIHACDVFAFPSYHEGLPVALMEAMAGGLPVVCSDIRGNVDLIRNGENGFLCPPDDVSGWQNALISLLENRQLSEMFIEKGQKVLENYTFGQVQQELMSLYR